MTLADTISDWVLGELPHARSDAETAAALRGKNPGDLLVLYINWRDRLIPLGKRKVMLSQEFKRNILDTDSLEAIIGIINDVENGQNLNKYLSRRVLEGFHVPKIKQNKDLYKLKHLDLLLNEWGIHHLHISKVTDKDGFVVRCKQLLFVMFRSDKAYFLDIGSHGSFEDSTLAEIAINNWPDAGLFLEIKGIIGSKSGIDYTRTERKQLRGVGFSSTIQVGEKVFSPAGGMTTAGTSEKATFQANHIMLTLRKFEEQVAADPSHIIARIRDHGRSPGDSPEFTFAFLEGGFGVIEKTSGTPILLGQLPPLLSSFRRYPDTSPCGQTPSAAASLPCGPEE